MVLTPSGRIEIKDKGLHAKHLPKNLICITHLINTEEHERTGVTLNISLT